MKLKTLTPTRDEQLDALRAEAVLTRAQIEKLRKALGRQQEFADQVALAVRASQPVKPMVYRPGKVPLERIEAVLNLGDWHIGEVTEAGQTEGFGEFNYGIAVRRLDAVTDAYLKWVETHRKGLRIPECTLILSGDWVSGDIHEELRRTNEFDLPEQTAKAGLLLGEVIRKVAPHFEKVQLVAVGGDNHGRLTVKPQSKGRVTNNMSYMVYALAKAYTSGLGNLSWITAEGQTVLAPIGGHKFLCEHGDGIKSQLGFPYYGMGRKLGKEAARRMNTDKGFHYWSLGHFHVPCIIQGNTLINGCLSGTSEFDHGQGRWAAPAQVGFLVHPRHGLFNWVPFNGV
jgi:hypothetical protein